MINGRGSGVEFVGLFINNPSPATKSLLLSEGATNNSLHFHSINQQKTSKLLFFD